MRKIITILVLGVITSSYGFAQTSVWQINKDDKTIYLGGSVHVLRASDFPLPQEFDAALSAASVLVIEADVKSPVLSKKILSESVLPGKLTLKTILTKEQYKAIDKIANTLLVPMEMIETMKLGAALMTLNSIMILQKIGESAQGVDIYYYDKAIAQNKKIDFLESIDFQINLICNTTSNIDEFIKYSIENMNSLKTRKTLNKLISDWRTGNNTNGETEINEMKEKYPSVYKAMISDRNYTWLQKIEKYFEDDSTEFVIVGAAHLWGSDGLLNLLQEKGYEIKQLQVKK
jgi:uncharacterized protein YbaP (TraB family)